MRKLVCLSLFLFVTACSKKEDSEKSASTEKTAANAPATIAKPVGVLAIALDSFASIAPAMGTLGATSLQLDNGVTFTEADCNDRAEPLARESDPIEDKDNQNRLRIQNPRAPLQSFYCQMQKDTGSPDSFLGAISSSKILFCILGEGLVFDGVARDLKVTKSQLLECFKDLPADDQEEMTQGIEDSVTAKVTASRPAAFGDKDAWDGSVTFDLDFGQAKENLKILLRDSANIVAVAVNQSSGRPLPVDGYIASINRSTGEVHFEAKFQRLRSQDGSSSNGWNRHARAYVKGALDANLKFSNVTHISGIYSDISVEAGGTHADGLQRGFLWAVSGSEDKGVKASSYQLDCTYDQATQKSTCPNANLAASWKATAGSGSCNGVLTDTSCTSIPLLLTADDQTQFVMEGSHAKFQTTEDWMAAIKNPSYTEISFDITQ